MIDVLMNRIMMRYNWSNGCSIYLFYVEGLNR